MEQVTAIARAVVSSHKTLSKLKIDVGSLREELNDLLVATGLASSEEFDFPDAFSREELGKAKQINDRHAYVATVLEELNVALTSVIDHCTDGHVFEYLNEVFGTLSVDIKKASTFAVTQAVMGRAQERFAALAKTSDGQSSGGNDPFAGQAADVLASITAITKKLNIPDLIPQLNAGVRSNLIKGGYSPPNTDRAIVKPFTLQVSFPEVMMYLRALQDAASRIAVFERSQVLANRPKDDELNLFLNALADTFLRLTLSDQPRSSLKAGSKTPFIYFVMDVIEPYFPPDAMTPQGVAKRWQGLKKKGVN